ncbi:hypothetical protein OG205_16825 [Lentzea sp. NBC_00516]|uniref:hypothetical protein n=1 Tax=Lentzea sp. NBC_00516 TaxID=2903582 RepID=UPI002E8188C6|nr:hypothetical protein [Lentzea sp. NBC_00516]WUD28600.1 hypothetical protein OG205_16825 [Lentzea sp. NBC_00516]
MKTVIAWWDLDSGTIDVASLRDCLRREGVQAWAEMPGLVAKFWISNGSRWGAVMVFESEDAARQALPPNRAAELIGGPASTRLTFDVEAFVSGPGGAAPWQ